MKVLFITRCYPPVVGGMEKVSFELTTHIGRLTKTFLIANRRGKHFLPLFLPYALLKALILVKLRSIDIVHLGDAALAPLGSIIKFFCSVPVAVTVHGLDVIYNNQRYQKTVIPSLRKLDKLICVSRYTLEKCLEKDIPEEKCLVINNGVNPDEYYLEDNSECREKLQNMLGVNLTGKLFLLNVGHLVARKGVPWFIRSVMPKLPDNTIYLVLGGYGNASKGDEITKYRQLAKGYDMLERVLILGNVPQDLLRLAYNSADLLIMPNVLVEGDMEGFGVVALEAASCGLPVIASDLEGLRDAVNQGITGLLLPAYDAQEFTQNILHRHWDDSDRLRARQYILEHCTWDRVARNYFYLFKKILFERR